MIVRVYGLKNGGVAIFAHGTSAARGIAVFYAKKYKDKIRNIHRDLDGRLIMFDLEEDGETVTIVAIYAPNTDSPEFFRGIRDLIKNRNDNKIVIGDFNLTLDVESDRLTL